MGIARGVIVKRSMFLLYSTPKVRVSSVIPYKVMAYARLKLLEAEECNLICH
jgi:hypothetical protein